MEGNDVLLGSKRIICDNAHAVKPFGAIDTPTQGGTAGGNQFPNWGWALTPQPNAIPTNGSTITVYVDGMSKGHPVYNLYRSDIADLFPDYANSNGAVGYYYLNTTPYANGVHTIQWTVRDDAGNTDGIGSRYFTVSNSASSRTAAATSSSSSFLQGLQGFTPKEITPTNELPTDNLSPLKIHRDTADDDQWLGADEQGNYFIRSNELERIEITFPEEITVRAGYLRVGDQLRPLPVGSTLRSDLNTFFWSPGLAFTGDYYFVFIEKDGTGHLSKRNVTVRIGMKPIK